MIGKNEAGAYTCKAHPRWTGTEPEAAEHLREYHGDLWATLASVEVVPLNNRADKRAARRAVDVQRRRQAAAQRSRARRGKR